MSIRKELRQKRLNLAKAKKYGHTLAFVVRVARRQGLPVVSPYSVERCMFDQLLILESFPIGKGSVNIVAACSRCVPRLLNYLSTVEEERAPISLYELNRRLELPMTSMYCYNASTSILALPVQIPAPSYVNLHELLPLKEMFPHYEKSTVEDTRKLQHLEPEPRRRDAQPRNPLGNRPIVRLRFLKT